MSRRTTQREDGPGRSSRRGMLRQTAGAAVLGVTALGSKLSAQDSPSAERTVKNGRINQSIVYWCFEKYWDMDQACQGRQTAWLRQHRADGAEFLSRASEIMGSSVRSARST